MNSKANKNCSIYELIMTIERLASDDSYVCTLGFVHETWLEKYLCVCKQFFVTYLSLFLILVVIYSESWKTKIIKGKVMVMAEMIRSHQKESLPDLRMTKQSHPH